VRNCQDTIIMTIESVMAQDYPHKLMEVIFVDDGSEDNTLSIIKEYASKIDMKVKIFHHEWKGLGYSRNVVVQNASGKYIVWVDGDIVLSKDYVRKQVEYMEKHPNVGITQGKCWLFLFKNETLIPFLEQVSFLAYDIINYGKASEKLPGTAGSTYRYEALIDVGGFDDSIKGAGEDMDVAYRIRKKGWQIHLATDGVFYAKRKETWSSLWRQYFWHGYGFYHVSQKNKGIFKPQFMLPLVSFLSGLKCACVSFKVTYKLRVFFLPIFFVFKTCAWWAGFMASYTTNSHKHVLRW